ncbi:MAG: hypothetical protein U0V70_17090 [Terriglobia bacterium]
MSKCHKFVVLGFFVIVVLGATAFLANQERPPQPLSEDEVLSLVTSSKLGELQVNRVVELIQHRGVKFSVTDVFLVELKAREADDALLNVLRQIRNQGKDFVPGTATPAKNASAIEPGNTKPPATDSGVKITSEISEAQWPEFLERTREKALSYTEQLPNFICTQITQRFERLFPGGWQQADSFVAELSYYDSKEHYKILTVGNRITADMTMEKLGGTTSTGEFGTTLRMLFDPASKASFRLEGSDQSTGHDTVRLGFQVPLDTSHYTITYNKAQTIIAAYRGRCWVDPASNNVVRLESKAINIPETFPITRAEGSVDYDLAEIAGVKYWLPVRAEALLVEGARKIHTRNVIEFKKYRKFGADVKLDSE